MDTKQIIRWCWNNRLWFALSLFLCIGLGVLYFFSVTPKREVSAVIMLRTADTDTQQGEMMSIMGESGSKQAADEIKILTSRDLMEQVVDSLHLWVRVEKKDGLRWLPVYPTPAFAMEYQPTERKKQVYREKIEEDKYRIVVYPYVPIVDNMIERLDVKRLSRESQVITLSIVSKNPKKAEDMLNMLLDLYNQASVLDKNAIALQTQAFLEERIAAVQTELNDAELAMEAYKTTHQITDINTTASEYQALIEDYRLQLAQINLNLRILEDLDKQLQSPMIDNTPRTLYVTFNEGTVNDMISGYNRNVAKRITLMESAKETNPMVLALDRTLASQRAHIVAGTQEARMAAQTRQKHLTGQIEHYSALLSRLPEQERTYLEMKRNKEAKEQQYLYLIGKQEENTLLLASSSISAKVVEKAQMAAKIASPNVKKVAAASVIFGLLLPILVLFFGIVKKELE